MNIPSSEEVGFLAKALPWLLKLPSTIKNAERYIQKHPRWTLSLVMAIALGSIGGGIWLSGRKQTQPTSSPNVPSTTSASQIPSASKPVQPPIKPQKRHASPHGSQNIQQQAKQGGTGNTQIQSGGNTLNQEMTNSPGGIQAGGDIMVNGPLPPPDRILLPEKIKAAIELLKSADLKSGAVYITTFPTQVPEKSEISLFTNRIVAVFSEAGWYAFRDRQVQFGSISDGLNHGEGINCADPIQPTPGTTAARKALALLGYPCIGHAAFPLENPAIPYALYISVGTRRPSFQD